MPTENVQSSVSCRRFAMICRAISRIPTAGDNVARMLGLPRSFEIKAVQSR